MGFFDKFFKSNKPKELSEGNKQQEIKEPEDFKPDGKTDKIYFDPKIWREMTIEEKEKRIVAYSIEETQEILIDLIFDNKDGIPIDINLFRYGIINKYSLKDLKELVLEILNSQNNPEFDIKDKVKLKNRFNEFIEENKGEYSEEGKIILQNESDKEINIDRTFFINKKEYNTNYQDKSEYGSINNLVNMCNDKENLRTKKQRKYIDVETEVINIEFLKNSQKMKDILKGLYNLCLLTNDLYNGQYLRIR